MGLDIIIYGVINGMIVGRNGLKIKHEPWETVHGKDKLSCRDYEGMVLVAVRRGRPGRVLTCGQRR